MSNIDKMYFNRELSWLEFNARVLSEALRSDLPLLDRLKFISIFSSNLDEFFMVRVGRLMRNVRDQVEVEACPSGLSSMEVLRLLEARNRELVTLQENCLLDEVLPQLTEHNIQYFSDQDYSSTVKESLAEYFDKELFPVLTPLKMDDKMVVHNLVNLNLYQAFILVGDSGAERLAVVDVPESFGRFYKLNSTGSSYQFTMLEDIVASQADKLFPGYKILSTATFRVTKDADVAVDEEGDVDFMKAMTEVLHNREFGFPVRLEIRDDEGKIRKKLKKLLALEETEIYDFKNFVSLKDFMALYGVGSSAELHQETWQPNDVPAVKKAKDVFAAIRKEDLFLHHPYDSFDPVVQLLEDAANDPKVLSIKITLYRTSGENSPIVNALIKAARNGKQVTVLMELKARFDESRNIYWANQLESAGAIVLYGLSQLKVHCKALMVVRKERDRVRRYVHLGTGNYNEKTACLYEDAGLLTCDEKLTQEICQFFNIITGYSKKTDFDRIYMAPTTLKPQVLRMIKREAKRSTKEDPGLILAKFNSLSDPEVIQELYKASQAGVKIKLNIRGICMLVPGVKGVSENIEVVSVIDRYLEHARMFYFKKGGEEEVYMSSADWMTRNLNRRVELMFRLPKGMVDKVKGILEVYFSDNQQSHALQSDGSYKRLESNGREAFAAQEYFHKQSSQKKRKLSETRNQDFKVIRDK